MDHYNKRDCIIVWAGVAFVVPLLVGALFSQTSNREANVTIEFKGHSTVMERPVSKLKVSNDGGASVRLNAYCTIYWTNNYGIPTNRFFQHDQGYFILRPGDSTLVTVSAPAARLWRTSFTYEVRPTGPIRIYNRVRFWLPGNWRPDNSFRGRFGPIMTNASRALMEMDQSNYDESLNEAEP